MNARLDPEFLDAARREIRAAGLGGWLLYDLEARNRVSAEIVGLPDGISRRWFVLVPPEGPPRAVAHEIELFHWTEWSGELESYVSWGQLEEILGRLLEGLGRVAMEISPDDAVPFVDNVPAGVVELVEKTGVEIVSSAPLLSRTYAQWGETGRTTHEEAAEVLAEAARAAFDRAAAATRDDRAISEHELAEWIVAEVERRGIFCEGVIVAAGANSANPHYWPTAERSDPIHRGDVLLIDLWGKVKGEPSAVFADQTWMGVLGPDAPDGFPEAWAAVRDAREAAVALLAGRWDGDAGPTGAEVDAEARRILIEAGYEEAIKHRTGHAMDRINHGFGPNLDSVETRDERRIVRGIGFSVEPGVYLRGRWGIRSEINVHMTEEGPRVSPDAPQDDYWTDAG
jgi:Xaa-Pro aminopeptidase